MNTIISMSGVQKSYNYSGPTSIQSNVIARKKAVQRRVLKNAQFFNIFPGYLEERFQG